MKITEVSVRRLFTYGEYKNISFGYTGTLDEGEDPETAKTAILARIDEDWVDFIGHENRLREQERMQQEVKWEAEAKHREIDKMLEFLRTHGVDTSSYELPF